MSSAAKREESPAQGSVRIGVVGVGIMGFNHARVLSELSNVELVGVADPDRSQAMRVGKALISCRCQRDAPPYIGAAAAAHPFRGPFFLSRSERPCPK